MTTLRGIQTGTGGMWGTPQGCDLPFCPAESSSRPSILRKPHTRVFFHTSAGGALHLESGPPGARLLSPRVQQLLTQRLELAEVAEAGSDGKDWPLGRHMLEPWKSVPVKTMTSGLRSWGAGMPWL